MLQRLLINPVVYMPSQFPCECYYVTALISVSLVQSCLPTAYSPDWGQNSLILCSWREIAWQLSTKILHTYPIYGHQGKDSLIIQSSHLATSGCKSRAILTKIFLPCQLVKLWIQGADSAYVIFCSFHLQFLFAINFAVIFKNLVKGFFASGCGICIGIELEYLNYLKQKID